MTSNLDGKSDDRSRLSQMDRHNGEDLYRLTDAWEQFCPSVGETASARQDSGLHYVGEVQELQQSGGFKPMYPYQFNKKLSTISIRQDWRTHQIAGRVLPQVHNNCATPHWLTLHNCRSGHKLVCFRLSRGAVVHAKQ